VSIVPLDKGYKRLLTAKSSRLWYYTDGNGSVFPDCLGTIVVRTRMLELSLHHSQQYIVRRGEISQ
jgi:hypothetical protein